jgi:hypothetical protein
VTMRKDRHSLLRKSGPLPLKSLTSTMNRGWLMVEQHRFILHKTAYFDLL